MIQRAKTASVQITLARRLQRIDPRCRWSLSVVGVTIGSIIHASRKDDPMSRKAFLHVNGVNYELAHPIDGGEFDSTFQELERKAEALARGDGGHQFSERVVINDRPALVHFTTQGVFSAGAFLEAEKKSSYIHTD